MQTFHQEEILTIAYTFRAIARDGYYTLIAFSRRMEIFQSYQARVTTKHEKTPVNTPTHRVTAKPLTGPVPNWKRIKPATKVEIFESRIADQARW